MLPEIYVRSGSRFFAGRQCGGDTARYAISVLAGTYGRSDRNELRDERRPGREQRSLVGAECATSGRGFMASYFFLPSSSPVSRTARKAFCGISTWPIDFMRRVQLRGFREIRIQNAEFL